MDREAWRRAFSEAYEGFCDALERGRDTWLDPYAATYGAMALLEYNYNALGSWPLALTAYNHGANGIATKLLLRRHNECCYQTIFDDFFFRPP